MKHFLFLASLAVAAVAITSALYIDTTLYESPRAGEPLPDTFPDTVRMQLQILAEDAKQTVNLNLALLGAAGLVLFRSLDAGRASAWDVSAFLASALLALASIYCASLVNSVMLDMMALGVFQLSHPWLIGPAKLQYGLLLANTFVLALWSLHKFIYGMHARAAD